MVLDACRAQWHKREREGVIIKVFIKRNILSVDTILSAHAHTHIQRPPHTRALTMQSLIYYTA